MRDKILGEATKASGARGKVAKGVHQTTKSPLAREALDRIGALYRIENTIRGRPPDQRLAVRVAHTVPLMTELQDWLDAPLSRISGRSDLAKGIRYALSRW